MNFFTGFTNNQIISFWMSVVIFSAFAGLTMLSLAAFYIASKPKAGTVLKGALAYPIASLWFLMAVISTVWAAPAEKSFIDPSNNEALFQGDRFVKIVIGIGFAAIGVIIMAIGVLINLRQKREILKSLAAEL